MTKFGSEKLLVVEWDDAVRNSNSEGKVIGINFAMVRDFGGSNFAIPTAYAKSLLKPWSDV
jgi:hypothetical protein